MSNWLDAGRRLQAGAFRMTSLRGMIPGMIPGRAGMGNDTGTRTVSVPWLMRWHAPPKAPAWPLATQPLDRPIQFASASGSFRFRQAAACGPADDAGERRAVIEMAGEVGFPPHQGTADFHRACGQSLVPQVGSRCCRRGSRGRSPIALVTVVLILQACSAIGGI
jgi:hypothetical protein